MDPAQTDLEQAEIQKYIDRYQDLPPKQLQKMLRDMAEFTPTQEQNLLLQKALVMLLEQSDPAPLEDPYKALEAFLATYTPPVSQRPRQKRILIAAAIAVVLLTLTAAAFATQFFGLFLNVQEEYTQPMTSPGPASLVASWTTAPIPTDILPGFSISDASGAEHNFSIEFSNSQGERYYIYYSDEKASSYLDTELALVGNTRVMGNTTLYLVEKDELTTIYWRLPPGIASIDICGEAISIDEAITVAESMIQPKEEGEK